MQTPSTSSVKSDLNSAANKGQKVAKSLASDASEQMDTYVQRAEDLIKQYEPDVKAAAKSTMDFVRRHPVACILGAAALGYAIVALARRNRE